MTRQDLSALNTKELTSLMTYLVPTAIVTLDNVSHVRSFVTGILIHDNIPKEKTDSLKSLDIESIKTLIAL